MQTWILILKNIKNYLIIKYKVNKKVMDLIYKYYFVEKILNKINDNDIILGDAGCRLIQIVKDLMNI